MNKYAMSLIPLSLVMVLSMASCKKYEEGPAISLTSRSERVANTWTIDRAIADGNDVTSEELVLDFENDDADGTYQIRRLTEAELWIHKIGDDLELRLK